MSQLDIAVYKYKYKINRDSDHEKTLKRGQEDQVYTFDADEEIREGHPGKVSN